MYRKTSNRIILLLPVFGAVVFVVLYFVAAFLYPGGSQADKNSAGFSWINNYWCNLLNDRAVNGQLNPAKPVALWAMVILSATLSSFWFSFPRYSGVHKRIAQAIRISGVLAMAIALFLFTKLDHDLVINLASFCGVVATAGTLLGLYKIRWYGLFFFGLFNLLLVGINNYFYYTQNLIVYLPVVQKISFAAFLGWICSIDVCLYQRAVRANRL